MPHINMLIFWSAAFVVFFIVEAVTVGLVSIWFAAGALFALGVAALHGPLWLQVVVFLLVSAATLVLTRPLAKKYVNGRRQPTNADRVIGMVARVTEEIDNFAETGECAADGKRWTARSADDSVIPAGTAVTVTGIEGVKLIVKASAPEE